MKKIYMSPAMDIIELKKQSLLAGSATVPFGGDEDPIISPEDPDAPFMSIEEML